MRISIQRVSVQRILPAVILVGMVAFRIYDPGVLRDMRLQIFDLFQRAAPRHYIDTPVRVIDIDEMTLAKYGQWPWPRALVARLIDNLRKHGVAAIALDIVFAEPDRTAPLAMQRLWKAGDKSAELHDILASLPDPDEELAAAMKSAPVVTGFVLTSETSQQVPPRKAGMAVNGTDARQFALGYSGAVPGLQIFDDAAQGSGLINARPDRDGVTRRVPMIMQYDGKLYPSLSAEALRVAQGASTYVVKASGAQGLHSFGRYVGIDQVRIGAFAVPTDRNGQVWLYDTGHVQQRLVPAWRILDQEPVDLRGMIVFIGTSALGLKDQRATPLDPAIPGVELHAEVVEQILTGKYLQRPYWADVVELVFLAGLGVGMLLLLPKLGPIGCAIAGAICVSVGLALGIFQYIRHGWLFDPIYPSISALLVYLSGSLMGYLKAEMERRHVRHAFSHYLAPALVERLAADPSHLKLGGEMRDVTILFMDIRGFTTIAEGLDAQHLTHLINRFLTVMTAAVLDHDGTIDKYIGDSLMAFWNAPLDDPDHARNACRAALSMRQRLVQLNTELREEHQAARDAEQLLLLEGEIPMVPPEPVQLRIGIGINTGVCCVGNLGSQQRLNYSVMGDNVNLASRVEGLTKFYTVDIIITEATHQAAPGFHCRNLDVVQVKGRTGEVTIYALQDEERAGAPAMAGDVTPVQSAATPSTIAASVA
ncbi:MAG TPA: adenylate/guanylate cyclase domain-containing protein [Dongiaceae bacterium]|nr:adenylate/guanylate cyclase domain-containing protein [Dongiaceae bacterium]